MTEREYLEKYLSPEKDFNEALKRLENGEPVQYIVGDVNFYGNIIKVNKNVLIPRPETEELVEKTSDLIKKIFLEQNINILDIGTGSGCIAITLKKIFPTSNINGCDISEEALEVARENAKDNQVEVDFVKSNIYSKITNKYDCIISNPPYIRYDEEIMDIVKNNEPHIALYADDNGLYFYKEIIKNAQKHLNNKFIIAFEIGEKQAEDIINIAKEYFEDCQIYKEQDIQKLDRFIFIIKR